MRFNCGLVLIAVAVATPNLTPIGANVEGIADYDFTLPFIDVTRQSRSWGGPNSPWDGNCSVGADGWPNQPNFGNVFVSLSSAYPRVPSVEGNWSLFFEGSAALQGIDCCFHGQFVDQTYDATTDQTSVTIVNGPQTDSDCNCIMFGFYNASTRAAGPGLKNIRLLQPGYTLAQADDFSAPLLSLLGRFDVLRFMDWAATNGNQIVDWMARSLPSSPSWAGGRGVPWETIAALGNTLGKDIWVNIPAHASDDYSGCQCQWAHMDALKFRVDTAMEFSMVVTLLAVLQFAKLLAKIVSPALHIYVVSVRLLTACSTYQACMPSPPPPPFLLHRTAHAGVL
jgi:hypothetical protein